MFKLFLVLKELIKNNVIPYLNIHLDLNLDGRDIDIYYFSKYILKILFLYLNHVLKDRYFIFLSAINILFAIYQ